MLIDWSVGAAIAVGKDKTGTLVDITAHLGVTQSAVVQGVSLGYGTPTDSTTPALLVSGGMDLAGTFFDDYALIVPK